jgi:hypothetical protein
MFPERKASFTLYYNNMITKPPSLKLKFNNYLTNK